MLSERLATILPRLYVVKQQNETDIKPGIVWGRDQIFIEGVRGEIWKGYWNDLYTCITCVKVWEESVMFLED